MPFLRYVEVLVFLVVRLYNRARCAVATNAMERVKTMRPSPISLIPVVLASATLLSAQTKPATRPVLGTAQLPGDNGKLGQAYTMGTAEKLNIVLTGVHYSKVRWNHSDHTVDPSDGEKLLVVDYQIQNPNKVPTGMDGGALKFTAVDEESQNHEGVGYVVQKNYGTDLSLNLKPAQRMDCETVIVVPAKAIIPKLMVAHRTGGPVLRYDLHGKVAALAKPFSADGTTALASYPGAIGTAYPLLFEDAKVVSTAFQGSPLGPTSIDDKKIFMLVKVTAKNMSTAKQPVGGFKAEVVDEDGEHYKSDGVRKASLDDTTSGEIDPGAEMTFRLPIVLPKGVKVVKIRLWEQGNHYENSSAVEIPVELYATADGQPLKKG